MSVHLPVPGGDDNTWGFILNTFLRVAHNSDGTLKTTALSASGSELAKNKNQPSGYAGLDSSGLVPIALLPANASSLSSNIDVNIASPTNGQALVYNSSSSKWTNQVIPSSQTSPVSSVFGRTGVITAKNGDYSVSQITGAASLESPTFTGITTAPEFSASGLTGATASSRYVGATTSGAPNSGTFAVGDFVITQTGHVLICTTAGNPGTWTDAGSASNLVTSVFGRTGAITAQSGDYTATQVGALPSTDDLSVIATQNPTAGNWSNNSKKITSLANGSGAQDAAAFGQIPTSASSIGGLLSANNLSDVASPSTSLLHLGGAPIANPTFTGITTAPEFSVSGLTGATAASRYVGATTSGAPASGTFAIGDYIIDQTGKVWVCTSAGTPGTWTEIGSGGGSSGNFVVPYFLVVETYGAKVDGQVVQDGVMSSSSTHLACTTSTPFTSGDVGKQITVAGAGAAASTLVTTIASFTDSGHIILAAAASTTVSSSQVIWGTDDTTAWRNALAAIGTAGQGIAYCSKTGISLLTSSPVNHPFGSNPGLLNIPGSSGSQSNLFPVVGIMGPVPPPMEFSEESGSAVDNKSALVLFANGSGAQLSTTGTATANIINAGNGSNSTFLDVSFILRNLIIRTPESSSYNAINVQWSQQADIRNVAVDMATSNMPSTPQPQGGNYGFITPINNNGARSVLDSCTALGCAIGFVINEHCEGDHLVAGYSSVAYQIQTAEHSMHLGRISSFWNTHHVTSNLLTGASTAEVVIDLLDIEDAPSAKWYTTTDHILDSQDIINGPVRLERVIADVGPTGAYPTVVGGSHINLEVIGGPAWQGVSFINSWANASGGVTQFRKDSTGRVEIQFAMTSAGVGVTAFTLPAGFRPGQLLQTIVSFIESGSNISGTVDIATSGALTAFDSGGTVPASGAKVYGIVTYTAEN